MYGLELYRLSVYSSLECISRWPINPHPTRDVRLRVVHYCFRATQHYGCTWPDLISRLPWHFTPSSTPSAQSEGPFCPSQVHFSPAYPRLYAETTVSHHPQKPLLLQSQRKSLSMFLRMEKVGKTPTIGCPTPKTLIFLNISAEKTHMLKLSWLIHTTCNALSSLRWLVECPPKFLLRLSVSDPGLFIFLLHFSYFWQICVLSFIFCVWIVLLWYKVGILCIGCFF